MLRPYPKVIQGLRTCLLPSSGERRPNHEDEGREAALSGNLSYGHDRVARLITCWPYHAHIQTNSGEAGVDVVGAWA